MDRPQGVSGFGYVGASVGRHDLGPDDGPLPRTTANPRHPSSVVTWITRRLRRYSVGLISAMSERTKMRPTMPKNRTYASRSVPLGSAIARNGSRYVTR